MAAAVAVPTADHRHEEVRMNLVQGTRRLAIAACMLVAAAALAACGDSNTPATRGGAQPPDHAVHFGYRGEVGPEHWGSLTSAWATCGTGRAQSPIDVTGARVASLPDLEMKYKPTSVTIVNNGHAVQVNHEAGSELDVGEATYQLLQFHFHAPSEHTIDGRHYPIEMHLVHKAVDGTLAVVGVMIEEGASNPHFGPVWDNLPRMKGPIAHVPGASIDVAALLPKNRSYYAYTGSLTTPPCTEGVLWKVLAEPIEMSKAQIDTFKRIYSGNNRPVQPLNGRTIERN